MSLNLYLGDAFGWENESTAKVPISNLRQEGIISTERCPKAQLMESESSRFLRNSLKVFGYIPIINFIAGTLAIAYANNGSEFRRPNNKEFWRCRGVAMILTGPLLLIVDLAKFIYDCTIVAKYNKANKAQMQKFNTPHEHTPAHYPGCPVLCCTAEGGKPDYYSDFLYP